MSQSRILTDDIRNQYDITIGMLEDVIKSFPAEAWRRGEDDQQPAAIALHAVQALEFFFSDADNAEKWDYPFGKPAWEIDGGGLPTRDQLLTHMQGVKGGIKRFFAMTSDADLATPFTRYDWSGTTVGGHFVYALRHTMLHHGQLTMLRHQAGVKADTWP